MDTPLSHESTQSLKKQQSSLPTIEDHHLWHENEVILLAIQMIEPIDIGNHPRIAALSDLRWGSHGK